MIESDMTERFDERDTIFSRMIELEPGSEDYREYYGRNPQREEVDAGLRSGRTGVFSDRIFEQRQIDSVFSLITSLRPLAGHHAKSSGALAAPPAKLQNPEPAEASARVKKTAESYGAALCGITETDSSWVYSVRGRGSLYGKAVDEVLPVTIVFAVEMDEDEINRAPAVEQSMEVVKGYLNVAVAGLALSHIIQGWGWKAVCHMDGMSELVLPPAAEAAGLGSIGLHGVLVTKEFGPRVRLGAVTTDMPLVPDERSAFQVSKACRTCGKCASLCPSGCIPSFNSYGAGVDGRRRFSIDAEKCFSTWREFGTDCGVCLAACPFSHSKGKSGKPEPEAGFLKGFMFGGN